MGEVLQERGSGSLPGLTETNPRDHVKSISTTVKADTPSIRRIDPSRYAVSSPQNRTHIFEPNRSVVPFLSRLIDDSYEEMDVLDSATYLKKMLRERPKMGYQIETSIDVNDSVVLKDSLPPKENDPGSFTLPSYINNIYFDKALADLGASISVRPLSTFTNLGLGELAPTKLTVELADKTIKHPKCIVENVLVGIGKFVFPIDFIVLDMPEDIKVPLILERPFLSTTHAKIDVFKRKITLRVGDDKITFKSVKPASSLIKRVYVLGLRERMDLDLEARLMGEALILNRSLDPEF
ncbi:DNA/RNA polymerases superfamily protein, partial [Tanacetum coccineum]